ncbi:hypothetical protein FOXB_14288 [Fusarium oxysporum f. sp. conglutinans Fo5176]|uniref:Uncharacterized protein n=1 Tax=Fusarium oxysporum (strain Fo5176) TaxID=660025 RepID=F9G6K6_FUSOF|nr:hypothetical protein FOXB_14288 [Fusarium oxysporum f. sp. conglutinans Fo5176]
MPNSLGCQVMDYSSIISRPKSFFGKQKVWMARGEDLALFNTYRPNIQNLLRHSCIPESGQNLWIGLYRIGTTEDEAKTFVVVSCSDRRIRKLTRGLLNSCPIFQPGEALDRFKVISKATLPETACEPERTMQLSRRPIFQLGGVLDRFKAISKATRPEAACEPQQTKQDDEELPFIFYEAWLLNKDKDENMAMEKCKTTICIHPSNTGDSYLCRSVIARQVSEKGELRSQTATAGPLIYIDGRTYQLTVAHVVNFEKKEIDEATGSNEDDWDDDEDDNASRYSFDEDIASWNISARRNMTPEASNDENTDDDMSDSRSGDSDREVTIQQEDSSIAINEELTVDSAHLPSPVILPLSEQPAFEDLIVQDCSLSRSSCQCLVTHCQVSPEMDYLLIPTNVHPQTRAATSKGAELVQISEAFDLQDQNEPRPIIIATSSLGYIEGVVFPASSLLRSPGSKDFQTLFCIESNNSIPKGTSGSAVFDKQTGLLAGYIVLGCPGKNIWYMVPILDVLNDLEVRFRQKGKCQIRLDVDAAIRLSDQRDSLNTTRANQCRSLETSQSNPPHPENQEYQPQVASKGPKADKLEIINRRMKGLFDDCKREKPLSAHDSPESSLRFDEWRSRFGHSPNSPEGDRQLLDRFKTLEHGFLEAMVSTLSYPETALEEHQMTQKLRSRGTSFETTRESVVIEFCNHKREDTLQPQPWIEPFSGGKTLDRCELFELLRKKRMSPDSHSTAYIPRCIHIWNPDPSRVIALNKTASWLPKRGFQELLFNYIAEQPSPMIDFTHDTWFGSTFTIVFNLPFLAMASHDESEKRSMTGSPAVRFSISLSFLYHQEEFCEAQHKKVASQPHKSCLYHATWSTIVTGTSERYWTAACLSNGPDERPTVSNTKRTMSPRAYALSALAMQLEKITEYHRHIHLTLDANFKLFLSNVLKHFLRTNSRILERFETFLLNELHDSSDGAPGHPLWGSFYQEIGAPESAQRIRKSLEILGNTQRHLEILDARVKKLMLKHDRSSMGMNTTQEFNGAVIQFYCA